MTKPNDGGSAFPRRVAQVTRHRDGVSIFDEGADGMSLRAYLASQETLREWDNPEAVMSDLTGRALCGEQRPAGNWSLDPAGMIKWEAKWRAALKVIRADALIAELSKDAP